MTNEPELTVRQEIAMKVMVVSLPASDIQKRDLFTTKAIKLRDNIVKALHDMYEQGFHDALPLTREGEPVYEFEFLDGEWVEICSLSFERPIEVEAKLPRRIWICIAQTMLGKAEMIYRGYYGQSLEHVDVHKWAEQLEGIAATILNHFQPGDGNL